eukprot:1159068-Pelagomonas_calceolata.AAC.8
MPFTPVDLCAGHYNAGQGGAAQVLRPQDCSRRKVTTYALIVAVASEVACGEVAGLIKRTGLCCKSSEHAVRAWAGIWLQEG